MPLIAKIAVSAATYAIDKPYDYLLGEELGPASAAVFWCPSDGATVPVKVWCCPSAVRCRKNP